MTIIALEQAVENVIATGRIGNPVSLRVHWQGDCDEFRSAVIGHGLRLATSVFAECPQQLMAQQDAGGGQLTVQFRFSQGQIFVLTIGVSRRRANPVCHLLLVGQRGVVRLEGDDHFDGRAFTAGPPAREAGGRVPSGLSKWEEWIAQSLQHDAAIDTVG